MSEDEPRLWFKIVIPGKGAIGPGKIALLRAVDDAQSISGAARGLGMSYRRAWTLIDEIKRITSTEVVETQAGGAEGGGAKLTPGGRKLVETYDRIARKAEKAAAEELDTLTALADTTQETD